MEESVPPFKSATRGWPHPSEFWVYRGAGAAGRTLSQIARRYRGLVQLDSVSVPIRKNPAPRRRSSEKSCQLSPAALA